MFDRHAIDVREYVPGGKVKTKPSVGRSKRNDLKPFERHHSTVVIDFTSGFELDVFEKVPKASAFGALDLISPLSDLIARDPLYCAGAASADTTTHSDPRYIYIRQTGVRAAHGVIWCVMAPDGPMLDRALDAVRALAERQGVPVLLVQEDTYTTIERIEALGVHCIAGDFASDNTYTSWTNQWLVPWKSSYLLEHECCKHMMSNWNTPDHLEHHTIPARGKSCSSLFHRFVYKIFVYKRHLYRWEGRNIRIAPSLQIVRAHFYTRLVCW